MPNHAVHLGQGRRHIVHVFQYLDRYHGIEWCGWIRYGEHIADIQLDVFYLRAVDPGSCKLVLAEIDATHLAAGPDGGGNVSGKKPAAATHVEDGLARHWCKRAKRCSSARSIISGARGRPLQFRKLSDEIHSRFLGGR